MRRFATKAQAQLHLDTKGGFNPHGLRICKVPKKYQKGRFKTKPFAVADSLDWLHFGF